MASSRNLVSTIGAQASPTMGDGTRCPERKKEGYIRILRKYRHLLYLGKNICDSEIKKETFTKLYTPF